MTSEGPLIIKKQTARNLKVIIDLASEFGIWLFMFQILTCIFVATRLDPDSHTYVVEPEEDRGFIIAYPNPAQQMALQEISSYARVSRTQAEALGKMYDAYFMLGLACILGYWTASPRYRRGYGKWFDRMFVEET